MITLTEKAAQMVLDVIEAQELKNPYLELRITGGGCSGLQYALGLTEVDDLAIDEVVFESNGVNILTTLKESKYSCLAFTSGEAIEFKYSSSALTIPPF
jgi:iron-sulfur cluster assembly protein